MEVADRDRNIREQLQGAMKKLQANHAIPLFLVGVTKAPHTNKGKYVFYWTGDGSFTLAQVHDLLKSMYEEVCDVMKLDPKGVG